MIGHDMDKEMEEMSRIDRIVRLLLLFISVLIVFGIGFWIWSSFQH